MISANSDELAEPPDLEFIKTAAEALNGIAIRTPLLENADVDARVSGRLLIKAKCVQRTGAFKFRGAYNRIRQMSASERARGVVTYSSGNHAQGVALAAKLPGTTALMVMPDDVPSVKTAGVSALGAEITRGRLHDS